MIYYTPKHLGVKIFYFPRYWESNQGSHIFEVSAYHQSPSPDPLGYFLFWDRMLPWCPGMHFACDPPDSASWESGITRSHELIILSWKIEKSQSSSVLVIWNVYIQSFNISNKNNKEVIFRQLTYMSKGHSQNCSNNSGIHWVYSCLTILYHE